MVNTQHDLVLTQERERIRKTAEFHNSLLNPSGRRGEMGQSVYEEWPTPRETRDQNRRERYNRTMALLNQPVRKEITQPNQVISPDSIQWEEGFEGRDFLKAVKTCKTILPKRGNLSKSDWAQQCIDLIEQHGLNREAVKIAISGETGLIGSMVPVMTYLESLIDEDEDEEERAERRAEAALKDSSMVETYHLHLSGLGPSTALKILRRITRDNPPTQRKLPNKVTGKQLLDTLRGQDRIMENNRRRKAPKNVNSASTSNSSGKDQEAVNELRYDLRPRVRLQQETDRKLQPQAGRQAKQRSVSQRQGPNRDRDNQVGVNNARTSNRPYVPKEQWDKMTVEQRRELLSQRK